MKDLKRILPVVMIFIFTLTVQAQTDDSQLDEEKVGLSPKELEEAKMRFKASLNTPNYKKMKQLYKALKKNQDVCMLPNFKDDSSFIPWMKENLHLSEFISLEEAIAVRNEWMEVAKKVDNNKDPRLMQLLQKASREQGIEIIQPILDETAKKTSEMQ